MKNNAKISFIYEIDGITLHYSCHELRELEKACQKENILAPKKEYFIKNPRYKGLVFKNEPKTVKELIYILKNKSGTLIKYSNRTYSSNNYFRKGIYPLEVVFDALVDVNAQKDFIMLWEGEPVSMNNPKYHTFKKNNCCVCCGLEGKYLALEQCRYKDEESLFHFNMYGIRDGKEVLFTKDHIIPKSKGGSNSLDNYQTMCVRCNAEKGNRDISVEQLREEVIKTELKIS